MQRLDRRPSFRFRSPSNGGANRYTDRRDGRGYALLLVMMVAALLLVSLTAGLPSVYTEAQREKEAELVFRGTQYARAIYLFHQQNHRYPATIKELLRTNDLSFLRRPYLDPMTRNGKWRLIHAAANGVILDSKTITVKPAARPGGPPSGQQTSGFSLNSDQGKQPQAANGQTNSNSSAQGGPVMGAYIVGVASTSHRESIRVYNDHTHYDEWEFLGVPGVPGSVIQLPVGLPGSGGQPGTGTENSPSQGPKTPTAQPVTTGTSGNP